MSKDSVTVLHVLHNKSDGSVTTFYDDNVAAFYAPGKDFIDVFETTPTFDVQPEILKSDIEKYNYVSCRGVKRKVTGYELTHSDAYGCDVVRFSLGEIIDGV